MSIPLTHIDNRRPLQFLPGESGVFGPGYHDYAREGYGDYGLVSWYGGGAPSRSEMLGNGEYPHWIIPELSR